MILWFILGFICGGAVACLILTKGKVRWYQWILGAIGTFLFLFALQNFLGFLEEFETAGAWLMLLGVGLPGLIVLALAIFLPMLIGKLKKTPQEIET